MPHYRAGQSRLFLRAQRTAFNRLLTQTLNPRTLSPELPFVRKSDPSKIPLVNRCVYCLVMRLGVTNIIRSVAVWWMSKLPSRVGLMCLRIPL